MLLWTVRKPVLHTSPVLKMLVNCLMPIRDTALHCHVLRRSWSHHGRNLAMQWRLSNISIICFNPFSFFQIVDNWATKNVNVRPSATRKWTFNPDDVSTEDAQPNLVSNSRWQVFVRIPVSTRSFYTKVGAINRNEAVVSNIILFSVFPDNLQSAKQMLDCKHAK